MGTSISRGLGVVVLGMLAAAQARAQLAAQPKEVVARIRADSSERVARASQTLQSSRSILGIGADSEFVPIRSDVDPFGITHVRFQQRYRGLKVWGGQLVSQSRSVTETLTRLATLVEGRKAEGAVEQAVSDSTH